MTEKTKDFLNRLSVIGEKIKKTIEGAKEMQKRAEDLNKEADIFFQEVKKSKEI